MSNFTGVTFAQQKVLPSDDAIIRRASLSDGVLYGCEMSYSGSTLTMGSGQLLICGRQIRHPSADNWAIVDATSGFARLVLTVDLTKTSSKDSFEQVVDSIEYAASQDGFLELMQENVNVSGTRYQVVACVVSLGTGGITGIVDQIGAVEASGGGGGLNFSVVGGLTQPADHKENTIWVETNVDITGWIFSATEPEAPADGKDGPVWFATGTFSGVEFNALKKHGIQVYPMSANQYIGGAYVPVPAKTWQNGMWVDWWNGELYSKGDEILSITGGWVFSHDGENTGTFMRLGSTTANSNENKYVRTANKIPLGSYSNVEVHFTGGSMRYNGSKLCIEAIDDTGAIAATVTVKSGLVDPLPETLGSLDVSGLSESYYIQVIIYWDSPSNAANIEYVDFDEVICR